MRIEGRGLRIPCWIATGTTVVFAVLFGLSQTGLGDQEARHGSHVAFPVVTHYPEPGGHEADRRRRDDLGWGRFNASVTDHVAPTRERVMAAVRRWEKVGGRPVDVYNDVRSVKSGVDRLQVVNNVVVEQSLWTFFIGQNWRADGGPYLLVVCGSTGTSSNNSRAYGGRGGALRLPDEVARRGAAGTPFILAFANLGGRESQGLHPDALRSAGAGIAFARDRFNIDADRVVFAGKSRGGMGALTWGANPLGLDYGTAAIFAHSSATDWGEILYQPDGTWPFVGSLAAAELSPERKPIWQPGSEHEARMGRMRDVMAGSTDPAIMRSRSPLGRVASYRGAYLAVGWGTHEPNIGPAQWFSFCQALEDADIPFYAQFTLAGGHWNSEGVSGAFDRYLTQALTGAADDLPTGRHWNAWSETDEDAGAHGAVEGDPVFTILPRVTSPGRPNAVYVGAPDGSRVQLAALTESGEAWVDTALTIGRDFARVDLTVPLPGRYRWRFEVDGVTIPDSAIVQRDDEGRPVPPVTVVREDDGPIRLFGSPRGARAFGHAWVIHRPSPSEH